jgi:hypothetical protein
VTETETETDHINSPAHYRWLPGGIEAWDISGQFNFLIGSAMKYLIRHEHKGKPEEDIRKAIACLQQELRRREGRKTL